ncbi:flavin reductase family protein [Pseudoalteromonas viridis]|uniref:Flavin reductase family protein n=1 Tax=Pseudoalteromonas viridis TaxID=339617 RepID=A0ABX7V9E8_9GAMM|nr:flavin reductase family protein [Pseudoalteromonas viridis]QTL37524.1 flavin reductase family protein [Pseudoalteromonas viridis]
MELNFADFSPTQIYHLMTQTVIPRPIAWVLTESGEQNYNLAPFSYFTAVSSAPPLLMFSAGKKPGGEIKDTVKNIKATQRCVIHIASEQDAELVTQTAATLPHGESEVTANNVALAEFNGFSMPRIAHCDIAYGCELYEVQEIGDTPQNLVFVEIVSLYLSDKVTELDHKQRIKVHADKATPLARLGSAEYSGITAPFTKVRPE